MQTIISRWFLFGLLLGWSLTHATVFAQPGEQGSETKQGASKPVDAKPGATIDKVRAGLDKVITVDYTGQSLIETLNHVRDKSGLSINIDQNALMMMGINNGDPNIIQQYTAKGTNEKTSQILRRLLSPMQLNYVIFQDAVLVTSENMAMMRQMKQRVSVDVDEVPFKKAVRDLTRAHGINLVIDPKMLKQADAPVTLQLDNTGIETAVRLLAELANLKAVRMGNVMFVTSEEKAKKIRDEETHQFDNPLNPNFPGGGPMIDPGFGGGMRIMPAIPQNVPAVPDAPPGVELPPANPDNKAAPPRPVDPKQAVPPAPGAAPAGPAVPQVAPDGTVGRPPVVQPAPAVDPSKR